MNPKGAHPIDVLVGTKVRHFRTLRGMSQETLGETVGVTFQQVQKYEKGSNRISASRLVQIANALGIDVRLFFDGVDTVKSEDSPAIEMVSKSGHQAAALIDKMPTQRVKNSMMALMKAVAKQHEEFEDEEESA